jgi:hypothetical protein
MLRIRKSENVLVWLVPTVVGLTLAGPARAAEDDPAAPAKRPAVTRAAAPSPNATINLINLLVKQGVITDEQAAALIKQADDDAYVARQAVRDAGARADSAQKTAATAAEATSPAGTKRVTYVPEIVKKELREQIQQEVMARAEKEHWAAPGTLPEWTQRITVTGDVRVRYEHDSFPKGNYQYVPNYNAINTGSPYDTNPGNLLATSPLWPVYNDTENRDRPRLRARLGVDVDLYEGFWGGVRIATGDTSAPVSFNQSLGGSGGNFSKYAIWLDRAFIKYNPSSNLNISLGRFDNPFFSPTDLVWHQDLGFDGFAMQARYEVAPGFTPFLIGGAFPIFNTDLNAGSAFDGATFSSTDKWMGGVQVGANARPLSDVEVTVGAGYFNFWNVQGKLSSPCQVGDFPTYGCDTDLLRPSFAQRGNSYMALRNLVQNVIGDATEARYQYFGLASDFRNVVLSGRVDLSQFNPVHVVIDGDYVRNVAWNYNDIAAKVAANPLPVAAIANCPAPAPATVGGVIPVCPNVYTGGNQGYLGRLTVGHTEFKQLGDWKVFGGYKWLESDAVIDAFTDSDFGLGGTNLKGYFVGGSVALGPSVWLTARYMSANQIAGAPYSVDIFQADVNAKF